MRNSITRKWEWAINQWSFLTVKKSVSRFSERTSCGFRLCPLSLVLMPGTIEKSLTPSSLHPPLRYFYMLVRPPWAFSPSDWTIPVLSLSSSKRCFSPSSLWTFIRLSPVPLFLSCTGEPKCGYSISDVASPEFRDRKAGELLVWCFGGFFVGGFLGFFMVFLSLLLLKKTVTAEEVRFRSSYTNTQEKEGNQKFIFTLSGTEAEKPLSQMPITIY